MLEQSTLSSQGIVFFIDYNENVSYEKMVRYSILSLKYNNPDIQTAVIYCNDYKKSIENTIKDVCTYYIEVPQEVNTFGQAKKIANLYQIYFATPFEKTLYVDCDFLFFNNIDNIFRYLNKNSLCFFNSCNNFRGEKYNDIASQDFFKLLNIPLVYNQLFLFKKDKVSLEYFNLLCQISNNWQVFYNTFLKIKFEFPDIKINLSLALLLTDNNNLIKNNAIYINLAPLKINYTDEKNIDFYKHSNLWIIPIGKIKYENYILNMPVHYNNSLFLDNEFCLDFEKTIKNDYSF